MYIISKKFLTKLIHVLLIFTVVISLLGFVVDFRHTLNFGGLDLRNRVVGARLLNRGMDPYYFRWKPGFDEKLLDPFDRLDLPVSRVTVPPTVLQLQAILAELPYLQQKLIWLFLQWIALIGSLLALAKFKLNALGTKFAFTISLFLISTSSFWRYHVERGQIYIFYVFLLALAYWILQKAGKGSSPLGGILIGLDASLRLPVIMMLIPMVILRQFKLLIITLSSFLLFLLASVGIAGPQVWQSYFSAMRTIGELNIGFIKVPSTPISPVAIPTIVEGMNNLTRKIDFNNGNLSLPKQLSDLFGIRLPTSYSIILLGLVLLAYILLIYLLKRKNLQLKVFFLDLLFIIGPLMILIAEIFIPSDRNSYNNVQFLIPFFLVLKNANFSDYRTTSLVLFLIISLFATSAAFAWIPRGTPISELLVIALMTLMSLLIVKGSAMSQRSPVNSQVDLET
jgi:hypothetical protein